MRAAPAGFTVAPYAWRNSVAFRVRFPRVTTEAEAGSLVEALCRHLAADGRFRLLYDPARYGASCAARVGHHRTIGYSRANEHTVFADWNLREAANPHTHQRELVAVHPAPDLWCPAGRILAAADTLDCLRRFGHAISPWSLLDTVLFGNTDDPPRAFNSFDADWAHRSGRDAAADLAAWHALLADLAAEMRASPQRAVALRTRSTLVPLLAQLRIAVG